MIIWFLMTHQGQARLLMTLNFPAGLQEGKGTRKQGTQERQPQHWQQRLPLGEPLELPCGRKR